MATVCFSKFYSVYLKQSFDFVPFGFLIAFAKWLKLTFGCLNKHYIADSNKVNFKNAAEIYTD